jgi:hypothetical protein
MPVQVFFPNGQAALLPHAVAVREGEFPGTDMVGLECVDGESKVVGRFKAGEIVGYTIDEYRAETQVTYPPSPT